MKKSIKNCKTIFIIITIILFIIVIIINNKNEFNDLSILVSNIDNKKNILNENITFDLIYGAPHLDYIKSFRYNKKENIFLDYNDIYERGVKEYINIPNLLSVLDENNSLENIKNNYGQINFIKELNNSKFIVMDGWQLLSKEDNNNNNNLVSYTILKKNNNSLEKYQINTHISFTANNLFEINNEYYLSGIETKVDKKNVITNIVIYNIINNNKTILLSTNSLVNYSNFLIKDNIFITTYLNNNNEILVFYDLNKKQVIKEINISNLINIKDIININYIVILNNKLYCYYYKDNNTLGILELNDKYELTNNYFIDISNYGKIVKILKYKEEIYILFSNKNYGYLAKHIISNNNINEIIKFECINNEDNIFLEDIVFINIK